MHPSLPLTSNHSEGILSKQGGSVRKIFVLILLAVAVAAADPFNTVTAYPLPPRMGYFGPLIPVSIPLTEEETLSVDPMLWAGFGILPRLDMTFMLYGRYQPNDSTRYDFHLYHIMAEVRYDVIGKEWFALSPVIDFFMPLDLNESPAIGPGVMATGDFGYFLLHGNFLTYIDLDGSYVDILIYVAPEVPIAERLSVYTEANLYLNYQNNETATSFEIWPGVSWMPTDWLSVATACGVPTDLGYLSPGLAVYVSF